MVVDEAWRYLRDPVVLGRLTEAARTWRKRNAALILATQSVTDITQTPGASALLESMPTRLFLANPDFPEAGQATFQLSDDELRTVRELEPKRELYLRRPTTAAVLRLAVDPESYWLYTSSAGRGAAARRDGGALRGGGRHRAPGGGTGSQAGGGARVMRGRGANEAEAGQALGCCGACWPRRRPARRGSGPWRTGAGETAIAVTAQVRHTTTIVLPAGGDHRRRGGRRRRLLGRVGGRRTWRTSSRWRRAPPRTSPWSPRAAGCGRSLVAESSSEDPDLVVYVEGPERPTRAGGQRRGTRRRSWPAANWPRTRAEEAAARVELQAVEEAAASRRYRDHLEPSTTPRGRAGATSIRGGCASPTGSTRRLSPRRSRSRRCGTTGGSRTCARGPQESPALYELHEADRRFGRTRVGAEPRLLRGARRRAVRGGPRAGAGAAAARRLRDPVDARPPEAAVDVEDACGGRRDARGGGRRTGAGDGAMSREASRPGVEATVKRDSVVDSGHSQLAAAMSELNETLLLHGSVVSQSAELMSVVGDQLHEREKALAQLNRTGGALRGGDRAVALAAGLAFGADRRGLGSRRRPGGPLRDGRPVALGAGAMRAWALSLGCALAVTPAAAQGLDVPAAEDAAVTVMTRVRARQHGGAAGEGRDRRGRGR